MSRIDSETPQPPVAPCVECGSTDILLADMQSKPLNQGGGQCRACGRQVIAGVPCGPSLAELARIWNRCNDIPTLIEAENTRIDQARKRIELLRAKQGPKLTPLTEEDRRMLMTADEFMADEDADCLTCDDGSGVWATSSHKSDVSTNHTRPDWATHVVWHNR